MVDDTEARLRELEANMSELLPWKDRVDADLYNHGQDGLKTQFLKFMTRMSTIEIETEKRHKENRYRNNLIIGLLGLLIALIGLAPIVKSIFKTSVDFLPNVFQSQHIERASMTQNARY